MADELSRLVVSLEARVDKFTKALDRANGTANRRARSIERRFQQMNNRVSATLRGMAAPLITAVSLRGAQQLIDSATRIENALKVAGLSGSELERVYGKLFESAQRNAAPLEALTELYGRAALVQKELGITTDELLGFTDRVAVALRVSGQSASESAGALLQLSQALGSGVVRAEEFNSIMEGAQPIAQAAAAGLREAGGSVAKLRQLVVDGRVSSEAFFRAFEAGAPMLEEKVANAEFTVSSSFQKIQNSLIDAARRFDDGAGASRELAEALDDLAKYIQDVDFGPAITSLVGFIDNVSWGIDRLADFKKAIFDAARGFAEWHGGAAIGDALKDAGLPMVGGGATQNEIQDRIGAAHGAVTTPKTGRLPADAGDATDIGTITPRSLAEFAPPSGGKSGGGGRKGRGGGGSANELAREIEQIKERTVALEAMTIAQAGLNPLVDDYGFAAERAAAKVELENAAKKAGLEITPTLAAQIETLAASYAEASARAEQLAESQERARQSAEEMRELGKSVLGGFIKDIQAGKSASDALSNALGKVADKLLDIALNSLFEGGGGGGGLGGILGFIPKLFGFEKGGIAAHGRPMMGGKPMKRYAKGGIAREASIFGEAGPEAAVPLEGGRSIPVTLNTPNIPRDGMREGGSITLHVIGEEGPMFRPTIRAESQDTSVRVVRAGIASYDKQLNRSIGGKIANAQTRQM